MYYLILAAVLIAADQLLKYMVVSFIGTEGQIQIFGEFLSLTYIRNDGIALGMFSGMQSVVIVITSVIMLAIAVYILREYKRRSKVELTLLTVIVSGGIGNLIDRIRLGYVVDYINFGVWHYIFNFADICVVLGCIGLFIHVFFISKEN